MMINNKFNKYLTIGIILYRDGVIIDKYDNDNNVIFLSIPKHSYLYEMKSGEINDAESFIKRIEYTINDIFNIEDIKIKYKTRDIYWTKEMGDKVLEKNKDRIVSMFF